MGNPISKTVLTGATPTWDVLYKMAKITATANTTITLSGANTDTDAGALIFIQGGTGSYTLAIAGWSGDIPLRTDVGAQTLIEWVYIDGTLHVKSDYGTGSGSSLTQLSTPGSFAASAASASQIGLTWTDVDNESNYKIYRNTVNNFGSATLINSPAAGSTSYAATGLTAETTYYFWIVAAGDGVTYSDSAAASASATTPAASIYDDDAQACITAVETGSSTTLSTALKGYINDYVLALKAASIWTKFTALYPMLTTTAGGQAVNMKTPGTYNLTWSGTFTRSADGVQGDGEASYADTGISPATVLTLNNVHLSAYCRSVGMGITMGASNALTQQLVLTTNSSGGYTHMDAYNDTANGGRALVGPATNYNPMAHFVGSRLSSTDLKVYRAGTEVATSTGGGGTQPTANIYLMGVNDAAGALAGAGADVRDIKTLGLASIGEGLTSSEVTAFTNATNTLFTNLGRV